MVFQFESEFEFKILNFIFCSGNIHATLINSWHLQNIACNLKKYLTFNFSVFSFSKLTTKDASTFAGCIPNFDLWLLRFSGPNLRVYKSLQNRTASKRLISHSKKRNNLQLHIRFGWRWALIAPETNARFSAIFCAKTRLFLNCLTQLHLCLVFGRSRRF